MAKDAEVEVLALPSDLRRSVRELLGAMLPDLIHRADHCLGLARRIASRDPAGALGHLVFAHVAIMAALEEAIALVT